MKYGEDTAHFILKLAKKLATDVDAGYTFIMVSDFDGINPGKSYVGTSLPDNVHDECGEEMLMSIVLQVLQGILSEMYENMELMLKIDGELVSVESPQAKRALKMH